MTQSELLDEGHGSLRSHFLPLTEALWAAVLHRLNILWESCHMKMMEYRSLHVRTLQKRMRATSRKLILQEGDFSSQNFETLLKT